MTTDAIPRPINAVPESTYYKVSRDSNGMLFIDAKTGAELQEIFIGKHYWRADGSENLHPDVKSNAKESAEAYRNRREREWKHQAEKLALAHQKLNESKLLAWSQDSPPAGTLV